MIHTDEAKWREGGYVTSAGESDDIVACTAAHAVELRSVSNHTVPSSVGKVTCSVGAVVLVLARSMRSGILWNQRTLTI